MILLVADTGPLHYLVQIEAEEVLPVLAARVLLPVEVWHELRDSAAATVVRNWAAKPPPWLEICQPSATPALPSQLSVADRACIGLAYETQAMLLMDDRRG